MSLLGNFHCFICDKRQQCKWFQVLTTLIFAKLYKRKAEVTQHPRDSRNNFCFRFSWLLKVISKLVVVFRYHLIRRVSNEMIWIVLHSIHWQQQGLAVGFRHVLSNIKEGGFGEYQLYMQCMFSMHEIAKGHLVKKKNFNHHHKPFHYLKSLNWIVSHVMYGQANFFAILRI